MRVALHAEFTARAGCEAEVSALLAVLTAHVRTEPGNIIFEPTTRADDPRRFFVYEVYSDDAAFEAHLGAAHGLTFNAALAPLIEEERSALTMLTPLL